MDDLIGLRLCRDLIGLGSIVISRRKAPRYIQYMQKKLMSTEQLP